MVGLGGEGGLEAPCRGGRKVKDIPSRESRGVYILEDPATDTDDWATGPAKWDIRVQLNTGVVIYSSTVTFTVLPQITVS